MSANVNTEKYFKNSIDFAIVDKVFNKQLISTIPKLIPNIFSVSWYNKIAYSKKNTQ